MLYKVRKIDKNTRPQKDSCSGKQLFNPYPSVFAKSYVRCKIGIEILQQIFANAITYLNSIDYTRKGPAQSRVKSSFSK